MSTLSSANVTDVNLVLKERTHMRLYINMLIFTHNLGNWLILGAQEPIFSEFRATLTTQHQQLRQTRITCSSAELTVSYRPTRIPPT